MTLFSRTPRNNSPTSRTTSLSSPFRRTYTRRRAASWGPGATENWLAPRRGPGKHGRAVDPVAVRIEFFSDDQKVAFIESCLCRNGQRHAGVAARASRSAVSPTSKKCSTSRIPPTEPVAAEIDKMVYHVNLVRHRPENSKGAGDPGIRIRTKNQADLSTERQVHGRCGARLQRASQR